MDEIGLIHYKLDPHNPLYHLLFQFHTQMNGGNQTHVQVHVPE